MAMLMLKSSSWRITKAGHHLVCALQYCSAYSQSQVKKRKPRVKKDKTRKDELTSEISSPHLSEHTSEEGEVKVCSPMQAANQTWSANEMTVCAVPSVESSGW